MLDKEQIEAASPVLRSHWRDGIKIDALDDAMRPRDPAEGYAIQAQRKYLPVPKDRRSDAHMRGAELDGDGKIRAHAH